MKLQLRVGGRFFPALPHRQSDLIRNHLRLASCGIVIKGKRLLVWHAEEKTATGQIPLQCGQDIACHLASAGVILSASLEQHRKIFQAENCGVCTSAQDNSFTGNPASSSQYAVPPNSGSTPMVRP